MLKRLPITIVLVCYVLVGKAQIFPNLGGQRVGISGLTFLKNELNPRALALGGANNTLKGEVLGMYNNPALMAEVKDYAVGISGLRYGGGLNQANVSVGIPLNETSNLFVGVNNLSSGAMEVRTEFQPNGTGEYFYANNLCAGLGFAKELSPMFTFGVFAKYLNEQLAGYSSSSAAVDMGFLYRTDYRNLRFGVALTNFGTSYTLSGNERQVVYKNTSNINLDNYQAPTLFKMSVSADLLDKQDHKITGIIQLEHPNDNAENIRLGCEYFYREFFAARLGYRINVDGQTLPTFGIGMQISLGNKKLKIDYAAAPSDFLGMYHCIGFSLYLAKSEE